MIGRARLCRGQGCMFLGAGSFPFAPFKPIACERRMLRGQPLQDAERRWGNLRSLDAFQKQVAGPHVAAAGAPARGLGGRFALSLFDHPLNAVVHDTEAVIKNGYNVPRTRRWAFL
jgi:hypothetical protein